VRRRTGALVLAELRDPRAVEPLKRLQHDPDPYVRRNAMRALRELGAVP
jgi:HEAT repeat protein